jgi:hypothetical protein
MVWKSQVLLFCVATKPGWPEISSFAIRAELMASVEKSGGYDSQTNVVGKKHAVESEVYTTSVGEPPIAAQHLRPQGSQPHWRKRAAVKLNGFAWRAFL